MLQTEADTKRNNKTAAGSASVFVHSLRPQNVQSGWPLAHTDRTPFGKRDYVYSLESQCGKSCVPKFFKCLSILTMAIPRDASFWYGTPNSAHVSSTTDWMCT